MSNVALNFTEILAPGNVEGQEKGKLVFNSSLNSTTQNQENVVYSGNYMGLMPQQISQKPAKVVLADKNELKNVQYIDVKKLK
ncbi:hypothetical protein AB4865_04495 [Capnocytophaga sp. ARDL2]|uniref:hypothetical protein n=1 Tax=Capnocytophaga sp. ARDL2 TaxID=3238809 RepID=UPI003557F212